MTDGAGGAEARRPAVVVRSRGREGPAPSERPPHTILCVEDSPIHLKLVVRQLGHALGGRVLAAADVEAALTVLLRERPDLIVTDLMMPDLDGRDLVTILRTRSEWRDIPVIVHSVVSDLTRVRALVDTGVTDYILKPFDPEVAIPRIRRALAASPRRPEPLPARGVVAPDRIPILLVAAAPELLEKLPGALDPVYAVVPARSWADAVATAIEVRPWAALLADGAGPDTVKTANALCALRSFEKPRVILLPSLERGVGVVLDAIQRELRVTAGQDAPRPRPAVTA